MDSDSIRNGVIAAALAIATQSHAANDEPKYTQQQVQDAVELALAAKDMAAALAIATQSHAADDEPKYTQQQVQDVVGLALVAKDMATRTIANTPDDPAVRAFIAENPSRGDDCKYSALAAEGPILALPGVFQVLQGQDPSQPPRPQSEILNMRLKAAENCAQLFVDAYNNASSRKAAVNSLDGVWGDAEQRVADQALEATKTLEKIREAKQTLEFGG